MKSRSCLLFAVLVVVSVCGGAGTVFLTQHSMCKAKQTCERCMRLSQCAWCAARTDGPRCFPVVLQSKVHCDSLLMFEDHGLSLARSAKCTCARGNPETTDCVPPGSGADVACSGRGACACGRCVCHTMPEPNKIVSGRYCECDNFSCEGRVGVDCSEGPYCGAFNTTSGLDAAADPGEPSVL